MTDKSLPDLQNTDDKRNIPLQRVGVKQVRMPFSVLLPGQEVQTVSATVSLAVDLEGEKKGIHMSRPVEKLAAFSGEGVLKLDMEDFFVNLAEFCEAGQSAGEFEFPYYMTRTSPKSGMTAPMAYDVRIRHAYKSADASDVELPEIEGFDPAFLVQDESYEVEFGIELIASNCCPCSKAISDDGAHNQRIVMRLNLWLDQDTEFDSLKIESLINRLESAASAPMYPILKRPDEKHITEMQYTNPKFAEDVIRDAIMNLSDLGEYGVLGYDLEVEPQESIHTHNAFARHEEVFVG